MDLRLAPILVAAAGAVAIAAPNAGAASTVRDCGTLKVAGQSADVHVKQGTATCSTTKSVFRAYAAKLSTLKMIPAPAKSKRTVRVRGLTWTCRLSRTGPWGGLCDSTTKVAGPDGVKVTQRLVAFEQ